MYSIDVENVRYVLTANSDGMFVSATRQGDGPPLTINFSRPLMRAADLTAAIRAQVPA